MLHKSIPANDRHAPWSWEYANAAARAGATGFTATDIGKVALQHDDNSAWILTATTPTWVAMGGASSWSGITDKPSTFPPDTHGHTPSQISGAGAAAGQVLTWSGSEWIPGTVSGGGGGGGGGSLPRVVQVVKRDVQYIASATFVDVIGLAATITPSSPNTKILIQVSVTAGSAPANILQFFRLERSDNPLLAVGDAGGVRQRMTFSGRGSVDGNSTVTHAMSYLDAPGVVTPVTYKLTAASEFGSSRLTINCPGNDLDHAGIGIRAISTITLIEVTTEQSASNELASAKAWVNFNGSTAVIRSAFNVASVTRNGVGDYTITFATPMADSNYAAIAMGGEYNVAWGICVSMTGGGRTTTSFRFLTLQTNGVPLDANYPSIAIFGA